MRHIFEKMIAVAFALPEVWAVLSAFLAGRRIKVLDEFEYDHFAHFEFARFSGKKHAVAGNVSQQTLTIFGQLLLYRYPLAHSVMY